MAAVQGKPFGEGVGGLGEGVPGRAGQAGEAVGWQGWPGNRSRAGGGGEKTSCREGVERSSVMGIAELGIGQGEAVMEAGREVQAGGKGDAQSKRESPSG